MYKKLFAYRFKDVLSYYDFKLKKLNKYKNKIEIKNFWLRNFILDQILFQNVLTI